MKFAISIIVILISFSRLSFASPVGKLDLGTIADQVKLDALKEYYKTIYTQYHDLQYKIAYAGKERTLSNGEIEQMQSKLKALGYYLQQTSLQMGLIIDELNKSSAKNTAEQGAAANP